MRVCCEVMKASTKAPLDTQILKLQSKNRKLRDRIEKLERAQEHKHSRQMMKMIERLSMALTDAQSGFVCELREEAEKLLKKIRKEP